MIHWHNFCYILRHKWFVFVECCHLGIPWLGIIHDWSKFLPDEWWAYARYFYGDYPSWDEVKRIVPHARVREDVQHGFDVAWLKHQHRNKHHWQYWLLMNDTEPDRLLPVPDKYIREMVADWRGASRARGADVRHWWKRHNHKVRMEEQSRARFQKLLLQDQ